MAYKHKSQRTKKTLELPISEFCRINGNSYRNQVLANFLEHTHAGIPLSVIIETSSMSKPTVYAITKELMKEGLVVLGEKYGKTQTYILNEKNERAQMLRRQVDTMIENIVENYSDVHSVVKELAGRKNLTKADVRRLVTASVSVL